MANISWAIWYRELQISLKTALWASINVVARVIWFVFAIIFLVVPMGLSRIEFTKSEVEFLPKFGLWGMLVGIIATLVFPHFPFPYVVIQAAVAAVIGGIISLILLIVTCLAAFEPPDD